MPGHLTSGSSMHPVLSRPLRSACKGPQADWALPLGNLNSRTHHKPFDGIPRLDCYADADFTGLYHRDDPQDPAGACSRTGFVITLGKNPILWKSKLQTKMATSMMHAEYVATSTAMHSLVHLRHIHGQIVSTLGLPFDKKSNISLVFEGNQACLSLATNNPP